LFGGKTTEETAQDNCIVVVFEEFEEKNVCF
jgi:hypothetical protein